MILFLDFDGVLHPEYVPGMTPGRHRVNLDYWSCLPAFEAVIRRHPNWKIVISSTWRERRSLDELRAPFSPDIAARIIGVTPKLERCSGRRQREIEAWIRQNAYSGPILILDDWPPLFDQDCEHVLFTETLVGLDADAAAMLDAQLTRIESRQVS